MCCVVWNIDIMVKSAKTCFLITLPMNLKTTIVAFFGREISVEFAMGKITYSKPLQNGTIKIFKER